MCHAVDKVRRDGPDAALLSGKLHVSKLLLPMHHDGLHVTVLLDVVNQVAGEEGVGHVARDAVGFTFCSQTLEYLNPAVNEVCN